MSINFLTFESFKILYTYFCTDVIEYFKNKTEKYNNVLITKYLNFDITDLYFNNLMQFVFLV